MEQRPGDPVAMRPLSEGGGEARAWGVGTIHVTACDRAGNMIAVTASGGWIPSSPVVEALGFPLGSRMQTFFLDETHPNALHPGKRRERHRILFGFPSLEACRIRHALLGAPLPDASLVRGDKRLLPAGGRAGGTGD